MSAGSGTLRSLSLAWVLTHSHNKRVSGFAPLRPNLPFGQTSDTRRTLCVIVGFKRGKRGKYAKK